MTDKKTEAYRVLDKTCELAAKQALAIRRALNELGVPTAEYPANVANAVKILEHAL